jgi:hypothetical protein
MCNQVDKARGAEAVAERHANGTVGPIAGKAASEPGLSRQTFVVSESPRVDEA